MRFAACPLFASLILAFASGCGEATKHFTTTMELVQAEPSKDEKGVTTYSLELKYADCPGDTRRVIRADKGFAACATNLKPGDKLKAELVSTWQSEKGFYRSDIARLGECAVKQDSKDEANYELVQTCTDVVTTGSVVGVRCDRTRSPQLVAKCPWLRRK